jgi:hypothetical protein
MWGLLMTEWDRVGGYLERIGDVIQILAGGASEYMKPLMIIHRNHLSRLDFVLNIIRVKIFFFEKLSLRIDQDNKFRGYYLYWL